MVNILDDSHTYYLLISWEIRRTFISYVVLSWSLTWFVVLNEGETCFRFPRHQLFYLYLGWILYHLKTRCLLCSSSTRLQLQHVLQDIWTGSREPLVYDKGKQNLKISSVWVKIDWEKNTPSQTFCGLFTINYSQKIQRRMYYIYLFKYPGSITNTYVFHVRILITPEVDTLDIEYCSYWPTFSICCVFWRQVLF